jgi:hypothetical protein
MALAEDLTVFFADHGVAAVFSGQTATVLFDRPDAEILGGRVQTTGYVITFPANVFTTLAPGSTVTVAGVAYTVQQIRMIDDGAILQADLERN